MHGSLLVAHQHVLDGVLLVERVVDVEHGATGITPDMLHAFGLQGAHEDLGAHQFFVSLAGSGRCGGEFCLVDFHDEPFGYFSNEKPGVPLGPTLVRRLRGLRPRTWHRSDARP